jgi:hypothetical protein
MLKRINMSIISSFERCVVLCYNLDGEKCQMMGQLEKTEKRYQEIDQELAKPEVATNLSQVQALARERASIPG